MTIRTDMTGRSLVGGRLALVNSDATCDYDRDAGGPGTIFTFVGTTDDVLAVADELASAGAWYCLGRTDRLGALNRTIAERLGRGLAFLP